MEAVTAKVHGVKGKSLTLTLGGASGGGRISTVAGCGPGAVERIMFRNMGKTLEETATDYLVRKAGPLGTDQFSV